MSKLTPSLKSRLAVWVVLPILTCSAIDLLLAYRGTDRVATAIQQQMLERAARIFAEQFASKDRTNGARAPMAVFELLADKCDDHVFYAVRTEQGQLIDGDAGLVPHLPPAQRNEDAYFSSYVRGEPVQAIAHVKDLRNGGHIVVEVAQTLREHAALRNRLFMNTALEHLFLLALVLGALVAAVRWTLRPLILFSEHLARRQPGTLEPLGTKAVPRELLPVIDALNGYVIALDQAVSSHERFVANVAHRLRTSFAILTSQLNFGMRDERLPPKQKALLAAMHNTTAQGATIIKQLLTLATIEQSRRHAARDQSDAGSVFGEIVTCVIEELAPLAQRYAVELGLDALDHELVVHAPSQMLREITFNLIDNAIKHMNGPGSVSVQIQRVSNCAVLRVSDTGPGIAPEHRGRVFERCYRVAPNRPDSFGLGLSIVKEICNLLQGSIELGVPGNGRGLQVEVRLPLAS